LILYAEIINSILNSFRGRAQASTIILACIFISAQVARLHSRCESGLDGAGNPIYKSGRKATGKPFKKQGGRATESILRAKNGILSLGGGKDIDYW